MGDLEALVAALRDLEASSDRRSGETLPPTRVLDLVAAAPGSALPGDVPLAITRSGVAQAVGETFLVIFATASGMAALAFAWLLLRP